MSMTKEQEEAIEILEEMVKSYIEADECGLSNNDFKHEIKAMQTVLNMLKEKDREIEHQIEKRNNQKAELAILNEKQKEMNKLINDVKSYKGQFKRQEKQIRELKKENEEKDKYIKHSEEITTEMNEDINKLLIEIKEKDKQIDELVKYIDSNNYVDNEECQFQWDFKIEKCAGNGDCKECIKQYFEKLAKEKGK